jgi:hypothetical protein
VYNQFPGVAFLGGRPPPPQSASVQPAPAAVQPAPQVVEVATGSIFIRSAIAGEILLNGLATGVRIREDGTITINDIHTGSTEVAVRDINGQIAKARWVVEVDEGQTAATVIEHPAPEFVFSFLSPQAGWRNVTSNHGSRGGNVMLLNNITREHIEGRLRDVLTLEVINTSLNHWSGFILDNPVLMQELRNGSGVRFRALGDGQNWGLVFNTYNHSYYFTISTRRNRVVDITVPYTRLRRLSNQTQARFDKNNITRMEFVRYAQFSSGRSQNSTLKIFDFEVIP